MSTKTPTLEIVTTVPTLSPRPTSSNKGDFGRVLIVAGSRGMSGAAILCASAALRAGAGLVKVAVPAEILPIVATACPCCTTAALSQDADGRIAASSSVAKLCETQDVVAVGPGLDRGDGLTTLVVDLVTSFSGPMVIDADGLNALVGKVDRLPSSPGPRILTPHPGEFARLVGTDTKTVQSRRRDLAANFASEQNCIVVLKGHGTIVTDGKRVYKNTTGNPGMATGGTGDVLTGVIAALLGQGLAAFEAAVLSVYLHGLAGDLARDQIGEISLIATDLIDFLPPAIRAKNP